MTDKQWPGVIYEQHPWTTPDGVSNTQRQKHSGPYLAAVLPRVAHRTPEVSAAVADEAEAALEDIRAFDREVADLWDGANLRPVVAALTRLEAIASSRIEGLVVNETQLALAALGGKRNTEAALVLANANALTAALQTSDAIDIDSLLEWHRVLLAGAHREAGQLRDHQVWVGGSSTGPHQAKFVPPHDSRVEHDLNDLAQFVARTDLPVLQHIAVAHAQFETIHPFDDGNGRTGRNLVHAIFKDKGVTTNTVVPFSTGLVADTDYYYRALGAYREGDVEPIVKEFTRAAKLSVGNSRVAVRELCALNESWSQQVRYFRADAADSRLASSLIAQPVVSVKYVADTLGLSTQTAQKVIDRFAEAGILSQTSRGARNRVWQAHDVLGVVTRFSDRSRQRSY
jgi:Fic family protein